MSAAPKIQGWCPGALRPMQSGDGLLLRAKTIGPRLAAENALEIAAIAVSCGNGLIDLSQRAQLQLRGVAETKLREAQQRLHRLGLLARDAATESVLNFIVSPLAGFAKGAIDAHGVLSQLVRELSEDAALLALPGKFGFLIDDGGPLGLAEVTTDIRLEAYFDNGAARVAVVADGARDQAFIVSPEAAAATALALARAFLSLRKGREFELRRMRSVVAAFGLDAVASAAGLASAPYRSSCRAAGADEIFGAHALFAGVGAPSGRFRAGDLAFLAGLAAKYGAGELRLTPWRAILLPCRSEKSAREMIRAAASRGLIVDADDARLAVVACSGAPECPQALRATRGEMDRLAPLARRVASGGVALHISGCAKGCAMPAPARITLVAREHGFDLIDNGRAGDAPSLTGLGPKEIEDAIEARITRADTKPTGAAMSGASSYIRDGAAIYARSFAIIRAEARLERFAPEEERVAVRIIHASGMVEVADDIIFSPGMARAASAALRAGAPVLCDANMVAHGVTRARLPANNDVVCTLTDPRVAALAAKGGTTRSAAALELWRERLDGAVVAIGNAPTALFRLLELLDEGAPRPAAIIAMPVGFVGAAESKEAALADGRVPVVIVRGRKGGSAMAAAAINALASDEE
ncbi:MAG: hypothetical protein C3F11_00215 [Methylocystaceae bacterium]|nr:MAG: hypothetical protein C3F11_00215 [Methylocystaceae bacterium]